MKKIIIIGLLVAFNAMADEKQFHCSASVGLKEKTRTILTGNITSDTTITDVTYVINGDIQNEVSLLTVQKNLPVIRYGFYQTLSNADKNFIVFMPEKITELYQFQAIVRTKNSEKKLDCVIEEDLQ